MAKKLDIRKDIATRNYHITKGLFYFIYRNVMRVVGRKYHAHYEYIDDIRKEKGPAFVIFNHLSRIDHMYIMEMCYPRKMNMLAGYNEFFRSHLAFAFKHNNCLPKKQYTNDIVSTKAIMKIIKNGGIVAFAPEGLATNDGMNKPIVPGTGNFFKKMGIPVYFVELRGEYLQNNKTCLDIREGETYAKMSLLFSNKDLVNLTGEEIDNKINNSFRHDEYAWQKEKHIKWKTNNRICHRLDDLLYRCPKCGTEFEMEGHDNIIECHHCGNGATMDDYYDFHPFEGSIIPETPSKWAIEERAHIIKEIRENPNYSFSEPIVLGRMPNDHYIKDHQTTEPVSEGVLTIDHQGLHYRGNNESTYDFDKDYHTLYTAITENDSSYFDLYIDGEFTDFYPKNRHCSIKFLWLIEEMHRLHVNTYKNFEWFNYLYDDYKD